MYIYIHYVVRTFPGEALAAHTYITHKDTKVLHYILRNRIELRTCNLQAARAEWYYVSQHIFFTFTERI